MAEECNLSKTIAIKKNRLVVYTALFGDYDDLIDPPEKFEGCDFICFTDQKHLKSNIWDIRLVEECNLPPNMMNRRYKILPHLFLSDYDKSLYIDANITILRKPKILNDKYTCKFNFIAPKHFARDSIYDEAYVLIRSGRVDIKKLYIQTYRYLKSGYRCQNSMAENNILFREHNKLKEFSEYWWDVFCGGVLRDQLSLAYVAWVKGVTIGIDKEISAREEKFFSIKQHREKYASPFIAKAFRMVFCAWPYFILVRSYLFLIRK